MPIGAVLVILHTGCNIGRITAIGIRPICLRHKLSVLISRHGKFADCELVSDLDQVLWYRVSAKRSGHALALFFPRRSPHEETALRQHHHFGATIRTVAELHSGNRSLGSDRPA